ncbi:hypothetical protein B0H66DRAFT_397537 [Apodospora peruviana]|uniref:Secreted protein n=1 Tax=Apodospora peruviana TaxID=516989 RepID=A0AAE0LYH9_9PEZI|nr:hypothetical protein B0H66DRAFT_397537 [Apodospora peruviana]
MKPTQIAATMASLVSLVMAAATPANGGLAGTPLRVRQQVDDMLPMAEMSWTGPIFPGDATNTTLSGTAKSIYEHILAINPKYAEENPPLPEVEARGEGQLEKRDSVSCSYGSPVNYADCDEGLRYLRALGGGSGWCGANANSCARVSCSWKCGMHLCNTSGGYIQVYCRDIANDMATIFGNCHYTYDGWTYGYGRYTFSNHYTQLGWASC